MSKLPLNLQIEFFKYFNYQIELKDFEQWIYNTSILEEHLYEIDYVDLISLNFKGKYFKTELKQLVDKYLDYGEFEKWRMLNLLHSLVLKDLFFVKSLIEIYDLYFNDYHFLDKLGLNYGLEFSYDFYDYNDWEKLLEEEKESKINKVYENVRVEALRIINWIENGKIIFTNQQDEMGRYKYIDNRNQDEIS